MTAETDGAQRGAEAPRVAGKQPDLRSLVNRLAHALARELPPGDLAALRRSSPEAPSAAFWKVAASLLGEALPEGGAARDEAERSWAAILAGMALTEGLHRPGRRAGAALAEAGYSELRFERLLRARGSQLLAALRGAAQYLASKAVPLDWSDLAGLVLSEGGPSEEQTRRGLARSYYGRPSRND